MPTSRIQAAVDAIANQQASNQFGAQRYALLFKPGTYGSSAEPLNVQVGSRSTGSPTVCGTGCSQVSSVHRPSASRPSPHAAVPTSRWRRRSRVRGADHVASRKSARSADGFSGSQAWLRWHSPRGQRHRWIVDDRESGCPRPRGLLSLTTLAHAEVDRRQQGCRGTQFAAVSPCSALRNRSASKLL